MSCIKQECDYSTNKSDLSSNQVEDVNTVSGCEENPILINSSPSYSDAETPRCGEVHVDAYIPDTENITADSDELDVLNLTGSVINGSCDVPTVMSPAGGKMLDIPLRELVPMISTPYRGNYEKMCRQLSFSSDEGDVGPLMTSIDPALPVISLSDSASSGNVIMGTTTTSDDSGSDILPYTKRKVLAISDDTDESDSEVPINLDIDINSGELDWVTTFTIDADFNITTKEECRSLVPRCPLDSSDTDGSIARCPPPPPSTPCVTTFSIDADFNITTEEECQSLVPQYPLDSSDTDGSIACCPPPPPPTPCGPQSTPRNTQNFSIVFLARKDSTNLLSDSDEFENGLENTTVAKKLSFSE